MRNLGLSSESGQRASNTRVVSAPPGRNPRYQRHRADLSVAPDITITCERTTKDRVSTGYTSCVSLKQDWRPRFKIDPSKKRTVGSYKKKHRWRTRSIDDSLEGPKNSWLPLRLWADPPPHSRSWSRLGESRRPICFVTARTSVCLLLLRTSPSRRLLRYNVVGLYVSVFFNPFFFAKR